MRPLRAFTLCLVALAALSQAADAQAKTDLSGKWTFTVATENGTASPPVTIQQKGDSLSGTFYSTLFGEQAIKGAVQGNAFSFSFGATAQGTAITITYKGTIEPDGSLKGTVDFGGYMGGQFTAKKSP